MLEIILHAYSFMVAGLFVPTLCAYFLKRNDSHAALWAMIGGGSTTLLLIFTEAAIPFGLDPSIPGILGSALLYALVSVIRTRTRTS